MAAVIDTPPAPPEVQDLDWTQPQRELMSRMPDMVKGAGYVRGVQDGNRRVLAPLPDGEETDELSLRATKALLGAVRKGMADPVGVAKGFNPEFMPLLGNALQASPQQMATNQLWAQLKELAAFVGKDVTTTSPLTSGLVPFDLVAPTRLIYSVYSPLRTRFPRTQGQGVARRFKSILGIAGTQTGGSAGNPVDWSIPEFPGGQSFSNWPVQLPSGDTPAAQDVQVPYKFFGRSEQVSWLAQWAGQGFEDVAGLANLMLMQKGMLAEEYMLIGGTGTVLSQPAAPTTAARTAGTGETALSGVTTNVYAVVTANTYFGETAYAVGNVATQAWSSGQVIDVTIAPVQGALFYYAYTATGASNPGRTGFWRQTTLGKVGATKVTLQGALPTSGTNPLAADSGSGASTRYEGLASVLSGWGQNSGGPNVYPSGYAGGYINQSVGTTLNVAALYNALLGMWDNSATNNAGNNFTTPSTGYRADPDTLVIEAFDGTNLSKDIASSNSVGQAYQLYISQDEVGAIKAGSAVSQVQNPFTRSLIQVLVHPWWPQGTAALMSWKLPMSFANVNNAFEVVNVQDYVSIGWPVIDVTFRFSLFLYGAFVAYAPQYSGLLQGLQRTSSAPFS